MRPLRLFVLVLLALIGAAVLATRAQAAPVFGYTEPQFQTARWYEDGIGPRETARLLSLAGARVHRVAISWEDVEPEKGQFDYSLYGAMIQRDRELGILPVFQVWNAPRWAWDELGSRCTKPSCHVPPGRTHMADWRAFIADLVTRFPYAVGVEIWNEPNGPGKWQAIGGPNVADYTRVLCNAYRAVNETKPSIPVVSGSLNVSAGADRGFIPYQDFLHQMYDAGGGACLDGIGLHAYPKSIDLPVDDRFFKIIGNHRRIAQEEGDAGRSLWLTEFGFATPPDRPLTEAEQARGTLKAMDALEKMPDIGLMAIFSLIEARNHSGYGQITRSYHAKQAFCDVGKRRTGVNPCGDRDGDGITDVIEVQRKLEYANPDTDGDGARDGVDTGPRDPTRAGPEGAPPTITAEPPPTAGTTVTFGFQSSVQGATFECQLDGSGWTACSSPKTYSGLADGDHTFAVRAVDFDGIPGKAASRTFRVDPRPDTRIDSAPPGATRETRVSYSFSASSSGARFECRFDSTEWAPCSSPASFDNLSDGGHEFSVRAIDPAGIADESPATHSFTVDTVVPNTTITQHPAVITTSRLPRFGFAATEPSGFGCSLTRRGAASSFGLCFSPFSQVTPLADGDYTFRVRAFDAAGNTDPTPAVFDFAVDATGPIVTIEGRRTKRRRTKRFAFEFSEPAVRVRCKIDDHGYSRCESPYETPKLPRGDHVLRVKARDALGNFTDPPAERRFRIR